MPAIIGGAAIAGGASLLGGYSGNKAAAREARHQRDWATAMDNSKRQRDVADLKKAGLNPILASGFANSVPSGASAAQQNPAANLGNVVSSAAQAIRAKQEIRLIKAQAQNAEYDAAKKKPGAIVYDELGNIVEGVINGGKPKAEEVFNNSGLSTIWNRITETDEEKKRNHEEYMRKAEIRREERLRRKRTREAAARGNRP